MLTRVWFSFPSVRYAQTSATGVTLAEALNAVPPNPLTQRLQAEGSMLTCPEQALRTLFVWGQGSLYVGGLGVGPLQPGSSASEGFLPRTVGVAPWLRSNSPGPVTLVPK